MKPAALLLFLFTILTFASGQSTVRVRRLEDKFRFELCNEKGCQILGRENGYTREELEKWKQFRESTTGEVLPLIGFVAAISLTVASLAFFPLTAVLGVSAIALGGFSYFFWKNPQVQAGMPNDVYHEFKADPALLPELKKFLLEIDQGEAVTDRNPRILSGRAPRKSGPENSEPDAEPASPVIHAR